MKRINKDITKAFTLPGSFYSSEDFFCKVKKDIFEKSWQLITHESNLQSEKDAFPFRFLDDL